MMTCPAVLAVAGLADFWRSIDGAAVAATVSESVAVTVAPAPGAVPFAVAVLLIRPASISAWVVM